MPRRAELRCIDNSAHRAIAYFFVQQQNRFTMHYFCHDCGIVNGTLQPVDPDTLTDSQYKLAKYLKHTVPASLQGYNTVFTLLPSSEVYRDYIVTAVASGHIQVDDRGRTNVVWVASRDIGIALHNGLFSGSTDAVKVVLHTIQNAVHAFPFNSSELKTAACKTCGKDVPY